MGGINLKSNIMKLEEQFKENYRKHAGLEMNVNPTIGCVEIADNHAIGFAVWACNNDYNLQYYVDNGTIEQLLEIYKEKL